MEVSSCDDSSVMILVVLLLFLRYIMLVFVSCSLVSIYAFTVSLTLSPKSTYELSAVHVYESPSLTVVEQHFIWSIALGLPGCTGHSYAVCCCWLRAGTSLIPSVCFFLSINWLSVLLYILVFQEHPGHGLGQPRKNPRNGEDYDVNLHFMSERNVFVVKVECSICLWFLFTFFFESIGLVYAETATLFIMKLLNVTLNKMGGLN